MGPGNGKAQQKILDQTLQKPCYSGRQVIHSKVFVL